jgi:hypothetical protein
MASFTPMDDLLIGWLSPRADLNDMEKYKFLTLQGL